MADYHDRWIDCTDDEIVIRGYYVPWGTKHISYTALKSMRRVAMSTMRGQLRIWGTADIHYWAGLDPYRPSKETGFVLDVGKIVSPFVTPDEPDAFEAAVRSHVDLSTSPETTPPGPVI